MFRRDTLSLHRPLTGSEMEAAAEREKWLTRVKFMERVGAVVLAGGIIATGILGFDKSVRRVCDLTVLVLALSGLAMRRMAKRHS